MSYMNYGVKPDIVSMAKGLGGGMPIGAICATAVSYTHLDGKNIKEKRGDSD